jgi:hypothetical protein
VIASVAVGILCVALAALSAVCETSIEAAARAILEQAMRSNTWRQQATRCRSETRAEACAPWQQLYDDSVRLCPSYSFGHGGGGEVRQKWRQPTRVPFGAVDAALALQELEGRGASSGGKPPQQQ